MTNSFDELDENKFKLGKYLYQSAECNQQAEDTCAPCSFRYDDRKCLNSPPCDGLDRKDGRDVYYVEVIERVF